MQLTRRSFVTKVAVGSASLPFMKGLSSAQVRSKLGCMKIVDTAAMLMAVEKGFFRKDLEGKIMAVNTLNNIVHLMVMGLIARPFKAREVMSELAPKIRRPRSMVSWFLAGKRSHAISPWREKVRMRETRREKRARKPRNSICDSATRAYSRGGTALQGLSPVER
jgi:hypothetical protein